ncbi:MAG: bifunctional phosphoribosylaminoimidazolecarboxamide formyltransferase/IMP cyclohydrolase [Candidatus Marinimicrobia bacterium]|nr:bifunctional phosphoribosylaminoimidazolecarboxamide formyltransferase/IMP cyclohydrolase [Candidatus Neomarinimicrobiota bacterium]MCF7850144.1 bifunctional phosphoribosylaminoimidazolecarboxamide formyltransferase/IMP cyclohydrolase [Candidatus Neomarinimicrobiota bacterium]
MKRALISVSDKEGVVELAQVLHGEGVEVISTGGTAKLLTDNDIPVIGIQEITGFPECLGGRVKTLQPKIHGGILANRKIDDHMTEAAELGIPLIDLVVVNLYPFKETVLKPDVTMAKAIENIDIGGVTLIRAAAKNSDSVVLLSDPSDYPRFLELLKTDGLDDAFRKKMALKGFQQTAQYDTLISQYLAQELGETDLPENLTFTFEKQQSLRYGENPHQKAAFYREVSVLDGRLSGARQLHGKELSYNNIGDASAAIEMIREFTKPTVVALKHANPCGVGTADSLFDAYMRAYAADPVSIFGGIVVLNGEVDEQTALEMKKIFLEIIIAPAYSEAALAVLTKKKNLRILEIAGIDAPATPEPYFHKKVDGGLLIQEADLLKMDEEAFKVVTDAIPSEQQWNDLKLAWSVVKHTKSNAIVVVKDGATQGVGGGQTSRIWAVENALERSQSSTEGSVLASDAFFPFSDSVEKAHEAGVMAIIQPGGSVRDQDSIDACNKFGMAMVFTDVRHFKH